MQLPTPELYSAPCHQPEGSQGEVTAPTPGLLGQPAGPCAPSLLSMLCAGLSDKSRQPHCQEAWVPSLCEKCSPAVEGDSGDFMVARMVSALRDRGQERGDIPGNVAFRLMLAVLGCFWEQSDAGLLCKGPVTGKLLYWKSCVRSRAAEVGKPWGVIT